MSEENKRLSDSVLIGLFTILSYVSAYQFESGYLAYSGIPNSFISLNIEQTIRAAFGILLFASFVAIFANIIALEWKGLIKTPFRRFILMHLLLFFILWVVYLATGEFKKFLPLFIFAVLWIDLFYLVVPAVIDKLFEKDKKPVFERMETGFKRQDLGIVSRFASVVGERNYNILFQILLFVMFCYGAGWYTARSTTEFLATPLNKQILIRVYDSTAILKLFDRRNKKLLNVISLYSLSDMADTKLHEVEIDEIFVEK